MKGSVFGILVGGKGTRMGGRPKGLLQVPHCDETIIARTVRVISQSAPSAIVLLVGESSAYTCFDGLRLADDPPDIGPIGGLRALLRYGSSEGRHVIALGCDMPYLAPRVLKRLLSWPCGAAAVCPKRHKRWEPLCARYSPSPCLDALDPLLQAAALAGSRVGMKHLLNTVDTQELRLDASEERSLNDWDSPRDMSGALT